MTKRLTKQSTLLAAAMISLLLGTGLIPAPSVSASSLGSCGPAANARHPTGKAARITGRLHTCPDGTIRNARGKKIRVEALEYLRLGWGSPSIGGRCQLQWTSLPHFAGSDVAGWGFNAVELFVSWQDLEPLPPTLDPVTGKLV